jgi:hypothetical protein
MRSFSGIHGTQPAPEAPPPASVLPFEPSARLKVSETDEAPSWMPEGMRAFLDVGAIQTAPLPSTHPDALRATLPLSAAPSSPLPTPAISSPRLSLEQHGMLYAELAVHPTRRADILHRHGLDEERWRQLDEI